jgi:hypothetical protein
LLSAVAILLFLASSIASVRFDGARSRGVAARNAFPEVIP